MAENRKLRRRATPTIMAGATLESFVTSVELAGGQVYVPLGWGILPGISSLAEQVQVPA